MNKLEDLLRATRKNTVEAERISKRLDTLNKEKIQERKEGNR